MVKQKTPFRELGDYQVYVAKNVSDSGVWLSSCDTLDIAISVALNFHQLSNCVHCIKVFDPDLNLLVQFTRLETVPLRLQQNAR